MPPRSHIARALVTAATLAAPLSATTAVWAQENVDAIGLRSGFDSGFPTSPSTAPTTSPENDTPPSPPLAPADIGTNGIEPTGSGINVQPSAAQPDPNDEDETGPNYGKPRKKKPKLFKPDAKASPPLPALVPYRGAPGYRHVLNPAPPPKDAIDPQQPAPTIAVIPSPIRVKKPIPDPDPYKPTGVQVGELRLLPYFEATSGYETNPNQLNTEVKPSPVLRAEGGLDIVSDFPTNSLEAHLRGGYSDFPSYPNANRPDASAIVDGRIDVTRDDQINTEARFTVATYTPGSPLLAAPLSPYITSRPTVIEEGATLGAQHTFNRLSIGLKATFDRFEYDNALQSDGTIYPLSEENYNDYGLVARAAYEVWPAFIPFIEAGGDERVHDQILDLTGYDRNSVGVTARAGAKLEFTHLLTGTVSAGYSDRHYADPRLPNLRGPTVDGTLAYAATPLTTISFTASTTFDEAVIAGVSGDISRALTLEVDHQLFRNFTLSGIATYQPDQYVGIVAHEDFTTFTLKGAYSFTRDVQLLASASRQQLATTLGDGFRDYIFLTGIRLQR